MGSNPNNWKAAIDWLISEDGMQKVLEGAFRPRGVNDFTYEEKMALQKKYMYGEGLFDAQGMLAEWRALMGQNF
jgi:ABC-type Fe3+ transport system substrate-binding protein